MAGYIRWTGGGRTAAYSVQLTEAIAIIASTAEAGGTDRPRWFSPLSHAYALLVAIDEIPLHPFASRHLAHLTFIQSVVRPLRYRRSMRFEMMPSRPR
jgi:hypothetical protein